MGETTESKKKKKVYNTTDLDPESTFERHVFHRDQFAHYLRWTHILKEATIGETIVDFGCGQGNLLEVLYRNRFKCKAYIGLDIREKTIAASQEKYAKVDWATFIAEDLVNPVLNKTDFTQFKADKVCSFEVLEHIGKQNADKFLENFRDCGNEQATYYLSTPNFDERVGAAGNHTYDSGDGRGVAVQEFEHEELREILERYFDIEQKFGTFASAYDYKPMMNEWQTEMYEHLKLYYDANLVSNLMAPFFPEHSRNTMWILRRKGVVKTKYIPVKKKEMTPEEKEIRDLEKMVARKEKSLSTKVKNQCLSGGYNAIKAQLEYLEATPGAILPVDKLDYGQTVACIKSGIEQYLEAIK